MNSQTIFKLKQKIFIYLLIGILNVSFAIGQKIDKEKVELVVKNGHASAIELLTPSPDGKLLASLDSKGVVIIWDISSGIELRSFSTPSAWIGTIAFSPDSKTIAYGHSQGVKIWDVISGKELKFFSDEKSSNISFSPDGKSLANIDTEGKVVLWNIEAEMKTVLDEGHCYVSGGTGIAPVNVPYSLAFSSKGNSIAISSCERNFVLFDLVKEENIRNFENDNKNEDESDYEYTYRIGSPTFSKNDEILVGTDDQGLSDTTKNNTKIWNVSSGKIQTTLPGNFQGLSSDTKNVLTQNKNLTTLWDLASKTEIVTYKGQAATFLADNQTVAVANDTTIELYSKVSNEKIRSFISDKNPSIKSATVSPDGKSIAVDLGKSIKLWNLSSSENPISLESFSLKQKLNQKSKDEDTNRWIDEGNSSPFSSVAFSPNNKIIAAVFNTYYSSAEDYTEEISTLIFWDRETGRIKRTLIIGETSDSWGDGIDFVKFSPDGRKLAIIQGVRTLKLLDLYSEKTKTIALSEGITDVADPVHSFQFTTDGNLIVYGDGWGIGVVDVKTVEKKSGFDAQENANADSGDNDDLNGFAISVVVSPDGKMFGGAYSEKYREERVGNESDVSEYKFWDLQTNKKITFPNPPEWANFEYKLSIPAKINEKQLRLNIDGNQMKLLDSKTKELILTLVIFDNNDWLVISPNGLFDGTSNAWKKLFWRFENNMFIYAPVEAFFKEFYRPGLLQDIFAGNPIEPPTQDLSKIDIRQPSVKIVAIDEKPTNSTIESLKQTVKVEVEITDNVEKRRQDDFPKSSDANDVRLFRNGSLVRIWRNNAFELTEKDGCKQFVAAKKNPRKAVCEIDVPIIAGKNDFAAYAFNHDDVKSNDDTASVEGKFARRDGTLYVLAIGVNKYRNTGYNLNFAVPDVVDIGKALSERQGELPTGERQYAKTEVIALTDEMATKNNILAALRRFADGDKSALPANVSGALKAELLKIRQTQPEDALVIYYAGHGTSRGQRFYLLPHNFTGDAEKLEEQSVSDLELNDYLEKVDVGKMLMAIDACQSGQALGGRDDGRGPMNSKGLAQLAYDKGMLVLTAAQSQQAALEAVNINGVVIPHGLLTYVLLQALIKPEADKDGNKQLWEREWFDYAVEQVPQMQLEAMNRRHVEIEKTGRGTELVYKIGDNKNMNPNERNLQTPRVFYRRETESNPLILANP